MAEPKKQVPLRLNAKLYDALLPGQRMISAR